MTFKNVLVMSFLTLNSLSAWAGGGTVGSDTLRANNINTIDCRKGENYWDTNKGVTFDLKTLTITEYKDAGKTVSSAGQAFKCELEGRGTVVCQSEKFALVIDNVTAVTRQEDTGALSLLGNLVGVRNRYVTVTKGQLSVQGLLFDRTHDVVCSLER